MTQYLRKAITFVENKSALFVIISACILLPLGDVARANWPGFRGPTGLGYTTQENLPITWGGPENKNVLWTSPLRGQGHASPIVWDQAVIVCTVNWPADVNDLGDGNHPSPAAADGRLFLVGVKNIYCIGAEHSRTTE